MASVLAFLARTICRRLETQHASVCQSRIPATIVEYGWPDLHSRMRTNRCGRRYSTTVLPSCLRSPTDIDVHRHYHDSTLDSIRCRSRRDLLPWHYVAAKGGIHRELQGEIVLSATAGQQYQFRNTEKELIPLQISSSCICVRMRTVIRSKPASGTEGYTVVPFIGGHCVS